MGKLKGKITQVISKAYTPEKIADKTFNGQHRGEDMRVIFNRIMSSPYVTHEPQENGVVNMMLEGKQIGWYDPSRGMGDIDQKGYDKLKALEEKDAANGIGRDEIISQEDFDAAKEAYEHRDDPNYQPAIEDGREDPWPGDDDGPDDDDEDSFIV